MVIQLKTGNAIGVTSQSMHGATSNLPVVANFPPILVHILPLALLELGLVDAAALSIWLIVRRVG